MTHSQNLILYDKSQSNNEVLWKLPIKIKIDMSINKLGQI